MAQRREQYQNAPEVWNEDGSWKKIKKNVHK
jgi:hypothetical protein